MTTSLTSRAARVTANDVLHQVAATSPERALLAAILRVAVEDAAAGDGAAREWLASDAALGLLALIAPDGVDVETVQRALVARLPEPAPWQAVLPLVEEG